MTWTGADDLQVELTKLRFDEAIHPADVGRLREEQRRLAIATGRGLVSTDVTTTQHGIRLLEVVTKGRRGMGHDYIGSASGTDGAYTYTVRITAHEAGVTGLREAGVSAQLWELGELQLPTTRINRQPQAIQGWVGDPYDPAWDDDALNSVTDDERLDVAFPSHPLSRVRALLAQVRQSIVFGAEALRPVVEGADGSPAATERGGVRRLLSDTAARELQWKHNCFDAVAAALKETLHAIDGPNGNHDERVAEHLLLLGITQSRQEQHADAITSLSRALQIYRNVSGHDDLKTAVTMGHLARAHLELGDLARAATLFPPALEVLEAALPGQLALGMTLSGYGRLLIAQNNSEALPYVMRARAIAESLSGGQRLFLLQEAAGAPPPGTSAKTTIIQSR